MFGSLRISRCRLDDADREVYRGHFCGSCHALRELGGRPVSLLTNYDQAVLALVLGGLERATTIQRPCTAVPFRKVPVADLSPDARRFVAALDVALVEAKLIDDVADDDGRLVRRVGLRLLRPKAAAAHAELRELGFDADLIAGLPARQAAVERRAAPSLDDLAAPSAVLTGAVFTFAGTISGREDPALREFGTALGRFVYLWDAWTDRDDDRRRGRFNALDAALGEAAGDARVTLLLRRELGRLEQALSSLDLGAQGRVLAGLLRSMGTRVAQRHAPRSAEAGDCDCACAACGDVAGCCDVCSCCDVCLCWSTEGRERRRKRRSAKAGVTRFPNHE